MTEDEKEKLEEKKRDAYLEQLINREKIHLHHYDGDWIRFGVASDCHFGSIHDRRDLLHSFYDLCKKEGITVVYNCGDLVEGEKIYRGQEYERYEHGADNLVQRVIEDYPYKRGIKTYFICGNHDRSYWKIAGYDIGKTISLQRPDMIYLGQDIGTIALEANKKNVYLQLFHPDGGTAYAISYHCQKYAESLSGGQKPDIILIGHYHKAELMPKYRNILIIQAGTFCDQTGFMKRRHIGADVGGWIIEVMPSKKRIARYKAEFIAYYERELRR